MAIGLAGAMMSDMLGSGLVVGTALAAIAAAQDLPAPWRPVDVLAGKGVVGPALHVDGAGLFATWLQRGDAGMALVTARAGADGFGAVETLRGGRDFFANWADFADACVARNGDLVVACLTRARGGYDVRLLRRAGAGEIGELGTPYGEAGHGGEHGFVSMLPEGEAGVRLFWLDGRSYERDKRMELRTAVVLGEKVEGEEVLDPDVCTCCQTGAALVEGEPLVVYRGRAEGEIRDVCVVRRRDGAWTKPRAVATDGWEIAGCPVNGPAVATDGARVAVAWFTGAEGRARVRVAFSADYAASFDAVHDVSTGAAVGRVDLVPTPRGALLCWLDAEADGFVLRVQEWGSAGAIDAATTLVRLPAGRATGFPRMGRAGDDVWLMWVDPQGDGLRAARASLAPAVRSDPAAGRR